VSFSHRCQQTESTGQNSAQWCERNLEEISYIPTVIIKPLQIVCYQVKVSAAVTLDQHDAFLVRSLTASIDHGSSRGMATNSTLLMMRCERVSHTCQFGMVQRASISLAKTTVQV
jgi:hypothetical protein